MKYVYPNEHYSRVENRSVDDLYTELRTVYDNYREYNDPIFGGEGFLPMVKKFAGDDFYKLHFVAKEFLEKLTMKLPEIGDIVNYHMADNSIRKAKVLEVVGPEEGGLKLEVYHLNESVLVHWAWPGTRTYQWSE
jgi:hypothetical protein